MERRVGAGHGHRFGGRLINRVEKFKCLGEIERVQV